MLRRKCGFPQVVGPTVLAAVTKLTRPTRSCVPKMQIEMSAQVRMTRPRSVGSRGSPPRSKTQDYMGGHQCTAARDRHREWTQQLHNC
jgi:hypothetical protein